MIKGGRKAQLQYWRVYNQTRRDKDRARHAKRGRVYFNVVILGVKVKVYDR